MMSPTFFPGKGSLTPQIAAIRDEITLIDAHRTEHMDGTKVRQADKSCRYCQQYLPKEPQAPAASASAEAERAPLNVVNNLERTVDLSGKKGQITVPRSWVGKKVRVTLV